MATSNPTVSESVEAYLEMKAVRAPRYVCDLNVTLRSFMSQSGDLKMASLREEHFAKAFDVWRKRYAPGTFNKRFGHIQQWLMHASRRRQLRVSPAELLGTVERRRVVPRRRLYLSASELLAILETTRHPRDRMYLALAMNTTLRAGEVTSLKLEDVDLDHGSLHVLRHKTGTRDILPVTTDLDQELRRWLRFYTEQVGVLKGHFLVVPAKDSPAVKPRGHQYTLGERLAVALKPETQMRQDHHFMRDILAEAGYATEREGLHTIRRSMARNLFDYLTREGGEARDEALSVVQSLLGHSTQSITEKYIGVERFKLQRDKIMRGQAFLSAMAGEAPSNVRRIYG